VGSASVRDPSLPKRYSASRPLRRQVIALVVAMLAGLYSLAAYSLWSLTVVTSLPSDRINVGSQMIVQLDSFLTAGWVVAFFYYWDGWEKAFRASRIARSKLRLPNDPARQFQNASDVMLHDSMVRRENELKPTPSLFAIAISSVLAFIVSAVAAVDAVFTENGTFVYVSLVLLLGAAELMFATWYVMWRFSQRLRDQSEIAIERAGRLP
jgi:hypothetical protein